MVYRRASGVHIDLHVLDVEARRPVASNPSDADVADICGFAGMGDIWRGVECAALDRRVAGCWRKRTGFRAGWIVEFKQKNRVPTDIFTAGCWCLTNGEFTADNEVDRRRSIDYSYRFYTGNRAVYCDVVGVCQASFAQRIGRLFEATKTSSMVDYG